MENLLVYFTILKIMQLFFVCATLYYIASTTLNKIMEILFGKLPFFIISCNKGIYFLIQCIYSSNTTDLPQLFLFPYWSLPERSGRDAVEFFINCENLTTKITSKTVAMRFRIIWWCSSHNGLNWCSVHLTQPWYKLIMTFNIGI